VDAVAGAVRGPVGGEDAQGADEGSQFGRVIRGRQGREPLHRGLDRRGRGRAEADDQAGAVGRLRAAGHKWKNRLVETTIRDECFDPGPDLGIGEGGEEFDRARSPAVGGVGLRLFENAAGGGGAVGTGEAGEPDVLGAAEVGVIEDELREAAVVGEKSGRGLGESEGPVPLAEEFSRLVFLVEPDEGSGDGAGGVGRGGRVQTTKDE
jgi:hypothetical protein